MADQEWVALDRVVVATLQRTLRRRKKIGFDRLTENANGGEAAVVDECLSGDVGRIVELAVDTIRPAAEAKGIGVETDVETGLVVLGGYGWAALWPVLRERSEIRSIVSLLARIRDEFGVTIVVVAHDLNPLLSVLTGAVYLLTDLLFESAAGVYLMTAAAALLVTVGGLLFEYYVGQNAQQS